MLGQRFTLAAVAVALIASMSSVSIGLVQAAEPCEAIKKYMGQVEEFSTFNFGEDREKRLADAQKALHEQLAKLNFSVSEELAELLKRYVSLTSLGHDRMRKGDARLLVQARAVYDTIKQLCPWE